MSAARKLHFTSTTYTGQEAGPRLIVTGAVHGNETCGTRAIERVCAEIEAGAIDVLRGAVTFVPVANPLAYRLGRRGGERNLNRSLFPNAEPRDFEDRVANWLCPLLAAHDVLLDLHSFSAVGEPFVMIGPPDNDGPLEPFRHAASERALARRLGVRRCVDGWLATYGRGVERRMAGSDPALREKVIRYGVGTTEYMRQAGGYALTLECGRHDDPLAPEVAYRAVINTLAHLGLIDAAAPRPIARGQMEALAMVDVTDRLAEGDTFSRAWASFDPVAKDEPIGTRADGTPVLAPFDGRILFPDADALIGAEWFYMTRPNKAFDG